MSCYFCSLLLNRSVDQTSVLLLLFSAVHQVCGSNHSPVTSVFLLLYRSANQTSVLLLLFFAVEQVCRSNHSLVTSVFAVGQACKSNLCSVTSVLFCWTVLWIKPLSCYFCSLLLNSSVDQTIVLLLLFSSFEQFCGSNHWPLTSVLFCWTVLWIKPSFCYFCFLLLSSSVDETTVLLLLFSSVEQFCGSNHCPVTSVLFC